MHLHVDGNQIASGKVSGAQSYTRYWQLGVTVNAHRPNRTTGRFAGSISDATL